ncbi:protein SCAR2-like, partial [Triticum dicoccoides]|uniref:protein SCAR2-like n=1 Tax=Triticum dicoccoides TaxID=85692 RepID=UPI00188FA766
HGAVHKHEACAARRYGGTSSCSRGPPVRCSVTSPDARGCGVSSCRCTAWRSGRRAPRSCRRPGCGCRHGRQLGDLAQLAAEVFDDLHDQATRACGLTLGARRLQAELPLIEERLRRRRFRQACVLHRPEALCGIAGHGVDQPVTLVGGTRPCSIEKFIQRCHGPPQLSMLDKYDAGGEGACLKRYTDPSFRAHSAQHQRILHETKPDIQSSDIHSKPPAEEARHKKYSK